MYLFRIRLLPIAIWGPKTFRTAVWIQVPSLTRSLVEGHSLGPRHLCLWMLGDMANVVGTILSPATLPPQVLTGMLYLAVTALLSAQWLYLHWKQGPNSRSSTSSTSASQDGGEGEEEEGLVAPLIPPSVDRQQVVPGPAVATRPVTISGRPHEVDSNGQFGSSGGVWDR